MRVRLLNDGGYDNLDLKVGKVYQCEKCNDELVLIDSLKHGKLSFYYYVRDNRIPIECEVVHPNKLKFLKSFLRKHGVLSLFKANSYQTLQEIYERKFIDEDTFYGAFNWTRKAGSFKKWSDLNEKWQEEYNKEYTN